MTATTESMHDFYIYYIYCASPTEQKGTMKMGKNKEGSDRRTMKRRGNKERKVKNKK